LSVTGAQPRSGNMMRKPLFFITAGILLALISSFAGDLNAQCFGSLMLAPDFFEFDYLVRICVHFGDVSALPDNIECCRAREWNEGQFLVPIYIYNLHDGIDQLEFSIESNDSLAFFLPQNCFAILSSYSETYDGGYRLNLVLQACKPLCGPILAGYAKIKSVTDEDPVWVDLVPNRDTGNMAALDLHGEMRMLTSTQHGGYVGRSYLYSCQTPICEEPNKHVTEFSAEASYGLSVKLTWRAGGGNRTMIRYRTDRYPTGYNDGVLVADVPSVPGEEQTFFHTDAPLKALVYYTAFSLTYGASEQLVNNSFVECASSDTTMTDEVIAVEETSWGTLKSLSDKK